MSWKAANKSKAFGESFIFGYSIVWISVLAVVVIFGWYEHFSPTDYISLGLALSLPCIAGPLLLANSEEKRIHILDRYVIKANIFIFIAGYIGNHFFTHYFYDVLGMRYTGPLGPGKGLEINQVPVSMFLFTHPYFMTYHVLATPLLRFIEASLPKNKLRYLLFAFAIVAIAFFTALMETWTISGFPYYTYPDFYAMLTKGSAFYGVFFVVTFPWFYRLDEDPKLQWSIRRVVVEALAAMMVVLLIADLLKLVIKM